MKTENILQGNILLKQSKLAREEKAPSKKEQSVAAEGTEEKVDLSTRTSSLLSHASPSYDEVLELLNGTDFGQLKDMEWVSQEGQSSLQALL